MLTAFATAIGFVITVASLLGIGWVLDANIPVRRKRQVDAWAQSRLTDLRRARWGGAHLFDAIFGARYVSRRSVGVSAAVTASSVLAFYLVAHFTSDAAVQKMIWPFKGPLDLSGALTLAIYVPAIFLCDFLSFAQSRLFLSYIDRLQSVPVSVVLYLADMVFSLLLFVVGYSVARALVTVFIASSLFLSPYERASSISPDVVAATYHAFLGVKILSDPVSAKIAGLEEALVAHRRAPSATTERALIDRTLQLQYDDLPRFGAKLSAANLECVRDLSFARENQTRLFETLKASDRLILDKTGLSSLSIDFGGRAPFYQSLSLAAPGTSTCPLYVVHSRIRIDPRKTLANLHWSDYLLGALVATLNQVNQELDSKLSDFVGDDPVAQTPYVIGYAVAASNSRPLGIGASAISASSSFESDDMKTGRVFIPLGPLLASSLTANLIFLAYLLIGAVVATGAWLLEAGWIRSVFKREAIFLRMSAGLAAVIFAIFVLSFGLDTVFQLLVRLIAMQPFA